MRNRIISGVVAASVVAGAAFALANTLNSNDFDESNVNALTQGAANVCDLSVNDIGWNVSYYHQNNVFHTTGADLETPVAEEPCGMELDDVDEARLVLLTSTGAELLASPHFVTDDNPTDGLTFDWTGQAINPTTGDAIPGVTVESVDRVVLVIYNDNGTAGN